ncbi:MAG: crossover junction endodeoxyribonuclease RuvC [Pseudomonadota bacterium]
MNNIVRIIGIDPGLRFTGWGVIEAEGARLRYVASGRIAPPPSADLADRLCALAEGLEQALGQWAPDEAAVEETFVNADPRSALKLGQARGVCLMAPARAGLRVAEYAPNQIKKAVVGSGHAGKEQILAMVCRLLPKVSAPKTDEADALAAALCHASHRQFRMRASA